MNFRIDDFDVNKDLNQSGGNSNSPLLEPGTHQVRLVDMYLKTPGYDAKKEKYELVLVLEGPNMGPDFKGWLKDPMNPGRGSFEGKSANVKHDFWAFSTYTNKRGETVDRDQQIFRWVNSFAFYIRKMEALRAANIDEATIEDYVAAAKNVLADQNHWFYTTIAGQQYKNKNGYDAYTLFFPKPTKLQQPYAYSPDGDMPSNILAFNPEEHITVKKEREAESLSDGFSVNGAGGYAPVNNGFNDLSL